MTMGRRATKEGIAKLSRFLRLRLEELSMDQQELLERLAAIEYHTDSNTISRFINGAIRYPKLDLVCAIAALKLFTDDRGRPLTTDEFNLITCELMEPPGLADVDPSQTAYPEAVKFLLKAKGQRSVEQFAEQLHLKPGQLEKILRGKRPTLEELFFLAALFPDRNPMPLARIYGVAVDAPLPNGAMPPKTDLDQLLTEEFNDTDT